MASKKRRKEEVVEVSEEPKVEEKSTGKRPKKDAAQGKRHRTGARHRPRTGDLLHLLNEAREEEDLFS